MRSFCRTGNLKSLLSLERTLPDLLEELRGIVEDHYGGDFHRALQNDLMALSSQSSPAVTITPSDRTFIDIPDDVYLLLVDRLRMDGGPQCFYPHQEFSSDGISVNPRA